MKNSLLKGLMVFLTMLCTSLTYSQDVSGTVSDASGPLPGASVLVKGTTKGAQTDFDGKFTIKNAGSNAVLVFSYIGLKSQEVNVAGRSNVNVTLKEDSAELKEVVVIGYGSVKKKDATGAVDQLSSKSFDNVGAPSPADLLRGKVSGVQVTSQSGEPGAGASIRIRGNSSIRSGNGPLIVVDGVPLDGGDVSPGNDIGLGSQSARNPLNFINQNDIESMTILKDASSTAIYGSRGANGVVVITTKKSKSKEPQLTYSNSFTFSSVASNLDIMSAAEFVANGGKDNGSRSYDWKDAIMRNAFSSNHDVSFTKSTENSSTRVSIGASNTEGIVNKTGLDKYTFALNNSNDFFGGALKVDTKVNYSNMRDQAALISNDAGFIGNLIGAAMYWNPTDKLTKVTPLVDAIWGLKPTEVKGEKKYQVIHFFNHNDIRWLGEESFNLKDYKLIDIKCATNNILTILSNHVSDSVQRMICAGDIEGAISTFSLQTSSEDSIIKIVCKDLCIKLENKKNKLNYIHSKQFSSEKAKQESICKVQEKIIKLEQSLEDISRKIKESDLDPITYLEIENPVITKCCKTKFEFESITIYILSKSNPLCPICISQISKDKLVRISDGDEDNETKEEEEEEEEWCYEDHTKTDNVVKIIGDLDEDARIIIFSEFDNSMNAINSSKRFTCKIKEIKGSATHIDNIAKWFQTTNPNVAKEKKILFMNSKYAGAGLNLESGTDVFIYHRMNSDLTNQIIGRCQRPGRVGVLNVYNFTDE